jgi:hypothetical protein
MRGRLCGALTGVALAVLVANSAAAQQWPAYGNYGYGAGYDYQRNAYSYPRLNTAQSATVPEESLALYGNYLPMLYYSGTAYSLARAMPFESGQAYCQTVGSYLYCADIQSSAVSLLSAGNRGRLGVAIVPRERMGSAAVYSGVLATRSLANTVSLGGMLRSPDGTEWAVECVGPSSAAPAALTCR